MLGKLESAVGVVTEFYKLNFNRFKGKLRIGSAIALMSLSAVVAADITISGNISLSSPAPAGGVTVDVWAFDDSSAGLPGNNHQIVFTESTTSSPFAVSVSDDNSASWHVEVVCLSGCANYMDLMYYAEGEPDNTTIDWEFITYVNGGTNKSDVDFSLYTATTISGDFGSPDGAPAAGMEIGLSVLDLNKSKPDGWYQNVGSELRSVPGGATSTPFSIKVIDDGAASMVVQASCWEGDNPGGQCDGYVVDSYYAASGSTTDIDLADTLAGGVNHTNINFDILSALHIQGTISLPVGTTASGDIDIIMQTEEMNYNSNFNGWQEVTIADGSSSAGYDMKILASTSTEFLIVSAQCENNCNDYEYQSYYNDVIGQTAVREQATELDSTLSHAGISFALVEKYSGPPPMCSVLLDDFSGQAIDLDDWDTPESTAQLSGGKLLLSQKLISRAKKSTAASDKRFGVSLVSMPDNFEAKVMLTEADLSSSGTGSAFASLRGAYYYTLGVADAPDGLLGQVFVGFYIGDRGAGIEAWWEILESLDPDFSTYSTHTEGTLIAPGTLALGVEYLMELDYDSATKTFTFTLDGTSNSSVGPAEGTQSGTDYYRRINAGAVPEDNQDDDSISVQALYDDVKADGVLYDDFNASTLNDALWAGPLAKRELASGKLRAELISESATRQQIRARIAPKYAMSSTCLQGTVSIDSSSVIPSGTRARNRLDGYLYNALHDQSSYEGNDGLVWASISIEQREDGGLRAAAYAERVIGDYDDTESLGYHRFQTAVALSTEYEMVMELDEPNKQMIFRFEDEVWVIPILSDIHPVEPSFASKGFTVRTQSGPGELHATIDDVYVTPAITDDIADFSVDENSADTIVDLTVLLNKAYTVYSVENNSNTALVATSIGGAELTLHYLSDQNGTADITVRAVSGARIVDEPFTVTVNPIDSPPTVAIPIDDISVDEDAPDTLLDLSAVFEDAEGDPIVLSVETNTNSGLVSESLSGTNLSLGYLLNQSGTADITVRATANGQTVDDTFSVTVNAVDDPPVVANPVLDVTVDEDAVDTILDLSSTFSDVDSATIVLSVQSNTNTSLLSTGLIGNSLTLQYMADQNGSADITVRAMADGKSVDDVFTVVVSAVDDPPVVANPVIDVAVDEDAVDTILDLSNTFSDVDSAAIVLSILSNSDSSLVGASLIGNSLTMQYLADQNGSADITIRATADGKTVDDTFEVAVAPVNDPPVFTSPETLKFTNGLTAVAQISASDADNDTVTFALTGGVDQALFTLAPTGELSFIAPPDTENPGDDSGDNQYEITVEAFDGLETVEQHVIIVEDSGCSYFIVGSATICL